MNRHRCQGFEVYGISYFYSIPWQISQDAFNTSSTKINKIMEIVGRKNTYILHFSNKLTEEIKINVNKPVAYSIIAEKYCPKVYHVNKEFF